MIDPVHALAFSVQSNRGVYALLLGSGVSRASGIPTGWEITLELVRKLAVLHGVNPDPTPESWYQDKYGKEPDYADLLDQLTRTPAERQQLLRSYFEPNEQEREEGLKQPTQAHRAIAALAAQGYIKVILTTNFDRLIENALRDAGIEPTVLSSPDHVQGALPLVHSPCCVIKLHGDYLDTRIRNTPSELQTYPPEFDKLLAQIFDEFGLIMCGWSAEWDEALRNSIYRSQSRRFATYWPVRGELGDEAQRLIEHRRAEKVSIEGADTFFGTLQEYVEAVEEFSRPHPLSTAATLAAMKRYMSEPRYRIQFAELIDEVVKIVIGATSGDAFAARGASVSKDSFAERVRGYDAACSTLLTIGPIAGYWAEPEHYSVLERALSRLGTIEDRSGNTVWLSMKRYPALLFLFALGIGALEANKVDLLGRLFAAPVYEFNERDISAAEILPRHCLAGEAVSAAKLLPGLERRHYPLSDWIYGVIRLNTKDIIQHEAQHQLIFAKLEVLLALGFAHRASGRNRYWVPQGTFVYHDEQQRRVIDEIQNSLSALGDQSPFVQCSIFGDTADICIQGLEDLTEFIRRLPPF